MRPLTATTVLVLDGTDRAHKIAQQLSAGVNVNVITATTIAGAMNLASTTQVDVLIFGNSHDEHERTLLAREMRSLHPAAKVLWLGVDRA